MQDVIFGLVAIAVELPMSYLYVGLAVAGIVLQIRGADRLRRPVRASWAERG